MFPSDILVFLTIVYTEVFIGTLQLLIYWENNWINIWWRFCQKIFSKLFFSSVYPTTASLLGLPWSSGWWAGRNVSQLLQVLEPYLPISHTLHRLSKLQWFLSHNKRAQAGRSVSLLSAATGRPLNPPPPTNPQTNSVITTQLLQITAARALFVIKLGQRQCEPAAISASNYLLLASCLIDPNWRERRPRSDRGRRGLIESSDRKTHQETEAESLMGTSVITKDIVVCLDNPNYFPNKIFPSPF